MHAELDLFFISVTLDQNFIPLLRRPSPWVGPGKPNLPLGSLHPSELQKGKTFPSLIAETKSTIPTERRISVL